MKKLTPGRRLLLIYLALLAISQVVQLTVSRLGTIETPIGAERLTLAVPLTDRDGDAPERPSDLSVLRWAPAEPDPRLAPAILLHGSPGAARNFATLAPLIAESGRTVYALDLPGFGASDRWIPSYSTLAHARATLAAMDELEIDRAHVVGWSMGGGVGLWMCNTAPDRLASFTMMSSIGSQRAEGSGDYHFEHAKYALGYALLVVAPEAVPHFGLLGPRWLRHSTIRNFWDTDMREFEPIMARLRTPTLILHGRDDFLVHSWAAELHHDLIPTSSLVMLDAGHFLPFLQEQETAAQLAWFFDRHDAPGVSPLAFTADYAPRQKKPPLDLGPFHLARDMHWLVVIGLIILATFISEDATVITVGVLVSAGTVDWGVGLIGCMTGIVLGDGGLWALGRFAGRRALRLPFVREWVPEDSLDRWGRWFDKHTIKAVFVARAAPGLRVPTYVAAGLLSQKTHGFIFWAALAAFCWTPILLLLAILVGPPLLGLFEGVLSGPVALILSVVAIMIAVRVVNLSLTWSGRRRLLAFAQKLYQAEFWPAFIFYAPMIPVVLYHALRRGPMTFTCVNPGVSHGGGVVGESKSEILNVLRRGPAGPWVLKSHLIDAGPSPAARAALASDLIRKDEALGGFPVILKPNEAQRGYGLKLARDDEDVRRYFEDVTRPAILQRYAPGPHEAAVLWARNIENGSLAAAGRIFSLAKKEFPVVTGDGKRTLEELIWGHPRYRLQAEVFLKRFSRELDRVPDAGERVRLGVAGNHSQGAKLLDGSELLTPQLEARFDAIASAYRAAAADDEVGDLDFGRFDIRYESDEALRRGEGFAIIELNGTMSESVNIYDPKWPLWRRYAVLVRQWGTLYRLGAARRKMGEKPLGPLELARAVRDHYRGRGGSEIAD